MEPDNLRRSWSVIRDRADFRMCGFMIFGTLA